MAKRKVRPRPGALQELLEKKGITQMDAADGDVDRVDRKTLRKIDRGEEVKLETLQKVARKLRVPVSFLSEATPAADEIDDPSDSMHTVMLRQIDPQRFVELLDVADRVEWLPNTRILDEKARKALQDLMTAVDVLFSHPSLFLTEPRRFCLESWRAAVDRLFEVKVELNQRRLALLGANYLFWTCSSERPRDWKEPYPNVRRYTSSRTTLFSVEPSGTQSRRVQVSPGEEPPTSPPPSTILHVDPPRRLDYWSQFDDDDPFLVLTHRGVILREKLSRDT
jgi:transcriptional regulator with XRE-family HTH domain